MKKLITICLAVTMILAISGPSVMANLLVDPSFETNPLTTAYNVPMASFAAHQGIWGVEAATITGVNGGVTPAQGSKMLRMTNPGGNVTEGYQVTNVSAYAVLIDSGGAAVNLSAMFNVSSNVSAAIANVVVRFYDALGYWDNNIGLISSGGITLDNLPGTWQTVSVSGAIPVSTRWLVTDVMYNNASLGGNPGYVDSAELTIVPEPASAFLVIAGMGLFRLRNRKQ